MFLHTKVSVQAANYEGLLANAVLSDISASATERAGAVVDNVLAEFVGTKNTRQGARPNDASLDLMRGVISHHMILKQPIPVLIASAAIKMPIGGACADLAEVMAYRMLGDINRRVSEHYEPGMTFRFRMEDTTERVISDDVEHLEHSIAGYLRDTQNMVLALGLGGIIDLRPESTLANETDVMAHARKTIPVFLEYLVDSRGLPELQHEGLSSYQALNQLGWRGVVGEKLRSYFSDRFAKNYQTFSLETCELLIAKYLSCIAARYRFGMTGTDKAWGGKNLQLAFNPPESPPLPMAPAATTRVHIRTVSRHITTNHMTPWVARGAVCRGATGPRLRLLNWHDSRPVQTVTALISSSTGKVAVPVYCYNEEGVS